MSNGAKATQPVREFSPLHHEAGGGRLGALLHLRELAARSPCRRSSPRSARLLRIGSCLGVSALGFPNGEGISKKALNTGRLCMSGGARAATSKRKLLGWKSARAWFQRVKGLSWPARLGDVVEEGWRALRQNLSSSLHEALGRSSEVICVNSIHTRESALAREATLARCLPRGAPS